MKSKGPIVWDIALAVLLASAVLLVLALPIFPSQDGPAHLYYVDVLRGLLHHAPPYSQYFTLKSMVTPYMLEYYSLLALELCFSPEMSEKLMVCGYIVLFGLGFRYLVGSVGERRSPWTLAGMPFCMNALVYLGFMNYCLGLTLLLWMCGFWIRHSGNLDARRIVVLLAGLLVMLVTHPVPAAMLLVFAAFHLVATAWTDRRISWRPVAVLGGMGAIAMAWVGMFVDRTTATPGVANYVTEFGWFATLATAARLQTLMALTSPAYSALAILLLAFTALTLATQRWNLSPALLATLATSLLSLLVFCLAPERVNLAWYFPDRFPILCVLFLIVTVAANRPKPVWAVTAGVLGICATSVMLLMQWTEMQPIAASIAAPRRGATLNRGSKGLIVAPLKARPEGLLFDPYMWSGVHLLRRSEAILANAPWVELPTIPIGLVHRESWNHQDPWEAAAHLASAVKSGGGAPEIDFVVACGHASSQMAAPLDAMSFTGSPTGAGDCTLYRRRP